jgi:hypothetical protein
VKSLVRTTLTVAGILAAAGLEASPLPGFHLAAQSENFLFYTRDSRKVDAGRSQRFLVGTARLLEVQVQGKAAYYVHEHADEVASTTGVYGSGVTDLKTGEINAVSAYHRHEIVHRVAGTLGDPGRFFQEGLAVALGDEGRWNGVEVDRLAARVRGNAKARGVVEDFSRLEPNTAYPVAGSFVGFLIRTYGARRVSDFFRDSRPVTPERDRRFKDVFGVSVDQAWATWSETLPS